MFVLPFYGYYRVSTAEQSSERVLANHRFALKNAFDLMGREWDESKALFDVYSGRKDSRKNFQWILSEVKEGRCSGFAVRLDRMSRNARLYHEIEEAMLRHGAMIWSLRHRKYLDLSSTQDWAQFHTDGIAAQRESMETSLRIKDSVAFAMSEGRTLGGPKLFGMHRSIEMGYSIDESQREMALFAVAMYLKTGMVSKVRQGLIEMYGYHMANDAIRHWLRNPALRGHVAYKWRKDRQSNGEDVVIYRNVHPALIDGKTADQIDSLMRSTSRRRGKSQSFKIYALTGLMLCGRCNGPVRINSCNNRSHVSCKQYTEGLACGDWQIKGHKKGQIAKRGSRSRYYDIVDSEVALALISRAEQVASLGMADDTREPSEVSALRAEIERASLLAQADPDFEAVVVSKKKKLTMLLSAQSAHSPVKIEEMANSLRDPLFWEALPPLVRQHLYQQTIEWVKIWPDQPSQVQFLI